MGKHKGKQEFFLDEDDDSWTSILRIRTPNSCSDLDEEEDEDDKLSRKRKAARKKPRMTTGALKTTNGPSTRTTIVGSPLMAAAGAWPRSPLKSLKRHAQADAPAALLNLSIL